MMADCLCGHNACEHGRFGCLHREENNYFCICLYSRTVVEGFRLKPPKRILPNLSFRYAPGQAEKAVEKLLRIFLYIDANRNEFWGWKYGMYVSQEGESLRREIRSELVYKLPDEIRLQSREQADSWL